jgi:hypothetical protein
VAYIFRSEGESPARAFKCPRQTIAAGLPAFVFLKRAGKQRLCLPAREAARIDLGAMCPAVSGEMLSLIEDARCSAC